MATFRRCTGHPVTSRPSITRFSLPGTHCFMLLCGNRTSGSRLRGELIGVSLVLDGVSKELEGEVHVADVSLTLSKGSLNVLLGATLAGKTSLMRLMAGLHQPSKGRVIRVRSGSAR